MKRVNRECTLVLVAMLFLNGCGGTTDHPPLEEVTGTVTVDGVPIQGLRVVFQPTTGRRSVGVTDEFGKYQLEYLSGVPGAVLGAHRVEVTFTGEEVGQDEDAEPADGDLDSDPIVVIPARYNVSTTLEAEVSPGENTIDFELTTEP